MHLKIHVKNVLYVFEGTGMENLAVLGVNDWEGCTFNRGEKQIGDENMFDSHFIIV